ncbi:hypothetical protein NAS2_1108 [Conexivisphaera calida]|uniref:DUF1512 domain-containing protein n=2 Tax=Conexivisphaera calida TaxID=1874277 RepID=A0A4P2VER5_9ARCH|nr:hypothetical protein NAS2_1108 [Conexivisphaera calida]
MNGTAMNNPTIMAMTLAGLAIVAAFIFYGMRIQLDSMLWQLNKHIKRAQGLSASARKRLISELLRYYGSNEHELSAKVDAALNSLVIQPISLDPHGIVPKLDHVLRIWDKSLEDTVERLAPGAGPISRKNMTNLLELTVELERLRKILEHYYASAKKDHDLISLSYLQVYLPFFMEEAEALSSGVDALTKGAPIGDALGPMVVRSLVGDARPRRIAEDTIFYELEMDGRRIIAVKAEGPGGTVGRPGEAVERLLEIYRGTKLVISVDAALKLEGEETGSLAEGVGVAMGGPGTDRFYIESAASKMGVPTYAVVVKMSEKEAISEMPGAVRAAVPAAVEAVRRAVRENTLPGDTVIVVGVGNTIGVP